jgi:hypothetical protein
LRFAAADRTRYLELLALSEFRDLSQELTGRAGNDTGHIPLAGGWHELAGP